MMTTHLLAACLMIAAHTYSVPPAILMGIMEVEGGQVGQEVGPNKNGTYDLGIMQINTLWVKQLAEHWQVSEPQAREWIRDDACVNFSVAAWIVRQKINQTNSLSKAIAYYHSGTPHIGGRYRKKVIAAMDRMGLLPADTKLKEAYTTTSNDVQKDKSPG